MPETAKKSLAQRAYEGYAESQIWKTNGIYELLSPWHKVSEAMQEAWKDAADAVSLAVVESLFPEATTDGN